ncbi:MAG TPA: serine/threonine-protein kinase, partial [Streptomyces sp.]|nr:serine/threonine-protein kinase [Streptomyces sp.]
MGRVWRASDEILDRRVAVKEMRMDDADAEDSRIRRERTLREARATARIDHPNVVRVYDVAEQGDRLWIVMELVDSRSLEQLLTEQGTVSPREAARIGLGLAAALQEVHAVGVLHRDIKPGNVLLGRAGRVVLTDFGIAAIQDATSLTMAGMLVGSPDYMAPERVGGRPQGPPSDIWSLGATLCAAVGGQSPFSRPTTLATLHAVLYEEPEIPAAAGPLAPILASLLVKEPSLRPTLDDLHDRLQLITDTPPPPPGPPPPAAPSPDAGRTPPGALEPGPAPPGSHPPGRTPPAPAPPSPGQGRRAPTWSEPDPGRAAPRPQEPAAPAEAGAAAPPENAGGAAPVPPPSPPASGRTPHSGPSAEGSGSTGWSAEAHGDESRSAPDTGRGQGAEGAAAQGAGERAAVHPAARYAALARPDAQAMPGAVRSASAAGEHAKTAGPTADPRPPRPDPRIRASAAPRPPAQAAPRPPTTSSAAPSASAAPTASGVPHAPTLESPHRAYGPPVVNSASGASAPAQEAPGRAPEREQGEAPGRESAPDPASTRTPTPAPARTATHPSAGPWAARKNRILVAAVLTATAAVAAVM